jgi:hypothetical protein
MQHTPMRYLDAKLAHRPDNPHGPRPVWTIYACHPGSVRAGRQRRAPSSPRAPLYVDENAAETENWRRRPTARPNKTVTRTSGGAAALVDSRNLSIIRFVPRCIPIEVEKFELIFLCHGTSAAAQMPLKISAVRSFNMYTRWSSYGI